jgi:hypothetical protein
MFDPVSLGVMAGGGLLGMIGGNRQAKEAARRENYNAQIGANDTRFSPYVATRGNLLQETEAGPGGVGGAMGGLLAGFQQAQKIKGAGLFDTGRENVLDATKKGTDVMTGMGNKKALNLVDTNKFAFNPQPMNPYASSQLMAYNR